MCWNFLRIIKKRYQIRSFGKLLDISPKNIKFLKTFDSEFSYNKVWFADQNYKLLEIEM